MTIEALMSRHVHYCRPDHTLDYAASQMWDHDCGCVPVCVDDGEPRVIGMLTDRDICMAALFQGRPLYELKVADAMSRDIHVCEVDARPEDVELTMRELRVRRLPVTDVGGGLVGIVSLADLARAAVGGAGADGFDGLSESNVGHTLAAICAPGEPIATPPD
ncbi:MAG TPA: CBS domain-containing protein [Gammaproteobacteria bacterium]|nr:CBS domain-containing protein [Gammaproteobacteria bacterium]